MQTINNTDKHLFINPLHPQITVLVTFCWLKLFQDRFNGRGQVYLPHCGVVWVWRQKVVVTVWDVARRPTSPRVTLSNARAKALRWTVAVYWRLWFVYLDSLGFCLSVLLHARYWKKFLPGADAGPWLWKPAQGSRCCQSNSRWPASCSLRALPLTTLTGDGCV